jgi:serine protease Do
MSNRAAGQGRGYEDRWLGARKWSGPIVAFSAATTAAGVLMAIGWWQGGAPRAVAQDRGGSLQMQSTLPPITPQPPVQIASSTLAMANELSNAYRAVASQLRPSVVAIRSYVDRPQRGRGRGSSSEMLDFLDNLPPPMRERLEEQMREQLEEQMRDPRGDERQGDEESQSDRREQRVQSGVGSGVVIRADGFILTNNHVVEGSDALEVLFSDESSAKATIVGTDPKTDLAVIKVEVDSLPAVVLGDSEALQVGDLVLAIGAPFGIEQTVTQGIISGKNRVQRILADREGYEDFLQTDASINPGNSGGPLVNLRGEVIGINTAIASRSGGDDGVGFSVPTSLARPVAESLIQFGRVRRSMLGAVVGELTSEIVNELGLRSRQGAYIAEVQSDKPAARAGIEPGDVVVAINGKPIRTSSQLRNTISLTPPGQAVTLELIRDGRQQTVDLTVVEFDENAMAMEKFNELGMKLQPLTPELIRQWGIRGVDTGLLIEQVQRESPAEQAGLQPGEVIYAVNNRRIATVLELQQAINEAARAGRGVRLTVLTEEGKKMIVLQ